MKQMLVLHDEVYRISVDHSAVDQHDGNDEFDDAPDDVDNDEERIFLDDERDHVGNGASFTEQTETDVVDEECETTFDRRAVAHVGEDDENGGEQTFVGIVVRVMDEVEERVEDIRALSENRKNDHRPEKETISAFLSLRLDQTQDTDHVRHPSVCFVRKSLSLPVDKPHRMRRM